MTLPTPVNPHGRVSDKRATGGCLSAAVWNHYTRLPVSYARARVRARRTSIKTHDTCTTNATDALPDGRSINHRLMLCPCPERPSSSFLFVIFAHRFVYYIVYYNVKYNTTCADNDGFFFSITNIRSYL